MIVSLMLGALILSEVGVVDLEANLFFTVLSSGWSRCFGPRGTNYLPLFRVLSFGKVGGVDLEANLLFTVLSSGWS